MIELYDVGRVLIGPFKEGYRFIAEQGDKYIKDSEALGRIRAFHKDKSLGISQEDFNLLDFAWIEAIRNGEIKFDREKLVYSDVKPRFDLVKSNGDSIYLCTSGSKELISLLLGPEIKFDEFLSGNEIGDKNNPETFAKVWEDLEGQIKDFYDDKLTVVNAAHEGFSLAGGNPKLYLVDRLGSIPKEKENEFESRGIAKISSFNEIKD